MENRRGTERVPFLQAIAVTLPDETLAGSVAGNISLSGISLKVQQFIPIGSMLALQIRPGPSSQVTWIKGQVVRVREVLSDDCYEIGLKFVDNRSNIRAIGPALKSRGSMNTTP